MKFVMNNSGWLVYHAYHKNIHCTQHNENRLTFEICTIQGICCVFALCSMKNDNAITLLSNNDDLYALVKPLWKTMVYTLDLWKFVSSFLSRYIVQRFGFITQTVWLLPRHNNLSHMGAILTHEVGETIREFQAGWHKN